MKQKLNKAIKVTLTLTFIIALSCISVSCSNNNYQSAEENTESRIKEKVTIHESTNFKDEESAMPTGNYKVNITANGTVLTAVMYDSSSSRALKEMLGKSPITIDMSDYSNFEKVGSLGTALPRNDEPITTEPGDIILYQGSEFVIYYDTNNWNFTRLGKIDNATKEGLLDALGSDDVTVTLSLAE